MDALPDLRTFPTLLRLRRRLALQEVWMMNTDSSRSGAASTSSEARRGPDGNAGPAPDRVAAFREGVEAAHNGEPMLGADEFANQRASDLRVPATRRAYDYYTTGYESEASRGR